MRTYICPSYLKEDLLADLMEKDVLVGHRIVRPENYLKQLREKEDNHDVFTLYETYKGLKLSHLATSLEDINFIKGIIKDRELCDFYDIDIDSISIDNEYKKLLKATPPFSPIDYGKMDEDLYVVKTDLSPMLDSFVSELIKRGARYHELATHNNHKQRFEVLNLRCGADAIAQDIIDKGYDLRDCAIFASSSSHALLLTTMARYGISLNLSPSFKSTKAAKILAIIDYYEKPSIETYRKLVSLRLLTIKDTAALLEYLENNATDLNSSFDRFKEDDEYYYNLEKKAAKAHASYAELLKEIEACKDFKALIELAFKIVTTNDDESYSIKYCIERHRDHLIEGKHFLISELKDLKVGHKGSLRVLSYNQDTRAKYVYILDANINNYPGLTTKKGLLDETGLENTNYPSLKSRYQKAIAHFEHIASSAEISTFIFCQSTLGGKTVEYDIDRDSLPLAMKYYDQVPKRRTLYERKLSDPSVFFGEDDVLRGSVSRFEAYLSCPYKYFLRYGLKLREYGKEEIGASLIGNIFHNVLEKLINSKGKDYPNNADTIINEVLDIHRNILYHIFPRKKVLIDLVLEGIARIVEQELVFLKEVEANTDYSPISTEEGIDDYYRNDENCKVYIRGRIDRIDECAGNIRIIDYKTSSDNTLTKERIQKAETLQLPTYGIMYSRNSNKPLAGLFYLNVGRQPINYQPYEYKISKGLIHTSYDENFIHAEFIKMRILKGMVFLPDDSLDHSLHYISTGNATSFETIAKKYDDLVSIMDDIYEKIYTSLKSGIIDLSPDEKACEYCDFKTICHFDGIKGKERKISSEIELRKYKE